jgi:hypothetical protein
MQFAKGICKGDFHNGHDDPYLQLLLEPNQPPAKRKIPISEHPETLPLIRRRPRRRVINNNHNNNNK